jgi:hypothetical protein
MDFLSKRKRYAQLGKQICHDLHLAAFVGYDSSPDSDGDKSRPKSWKIQICRHLGLRRTLVKKNTKRLERILPCNTIFPR